MSFSRPLITFSTVCLIDGFNPNEIAVVLLTKFMRQFFNVFLSFVFAMNEQSLYVSIQLNGSMNLCLFVSTKCC
jgi:hypothetical protein